MHLRVVYTRINNMALLVRKRPFYRVKSTVVLIARADGHIIETAVRDHCHAHLERA